MDGDKVKLGWGTRSYFVQKYDLLPQVQRDLKKVRITLILRSKRRGGLDVTQTFTVQIYIYQIELIYCLEISNLGGFLRGHPKNHMVCEIGVRNFPGYRGHSKLSRTCPTRALRPLTEIEL